MRLWYDRKSGKDEETVQKRKCVGLFVSLQILACDSAVRQDRAPHVGYDCCKREPVMRWEVLLLGRQRNSMRSPLHVCVRENSHACLCSEARFYLRLVYTCQIYLHVHEHPVFDKEQNKRAQKSGLD